MLVDEDEMISYENAVEKMGESEYFVTGNMKNYPVRDFIITPAEMMKILDQFSGRKQA